MKKKIVFVVIDGLGDRKIRALGYKTPLEAAKTPNLDLAKKGSWGQVLPFMFPWQRVPASDTCHLALFGYNPNKYYLGRGPYEAVGIGIKLREGDVALRANFATVDENLVVVDRRAGRIEKTEPLISALNHLSHKFNGRKKCRIVVKKSFGHRAVLVLRGRGLSANISDSDPKRVGERVKRIFPKDDSKEAEFTASILNNFLEKAHLILKGKHSKANYLLVRGAGFLKRTPSFEERYGLRACCIAGGALYKGIAKILGMDLIKVRGATGLPNTNLRGKFLAAKKAAEKYDFVFLHIKAVDTFAEDGNYMAKTRFLEKIDKNLRPVLGLKNAVIVVTGDHSTCSEKRSHCRDPVPILVSGCDIKELNRVRQLDVLPTILRLL